MESLFRLGIIMSMVNRVSGPAGRIGSSIKKIHGNLKSLSPRFKQFRKYGAITAAVGVGFLTLLTSTVLATTGTQKALGELSSVGVKDLAAIEKAGADFSNTWAGTTKPEFIAAAYDIKSGIASLSDTGVAEFTKLAALTGKATKSTTAEMTSLFATGYGIYKGYYNELSDLEFGNLFSAGISASVQNFKTTGSGMAQAISRLGAAATTAKVPLEEQLSVLGMLQATMSGSEAGTKYKAMMMSAAKAGKALNLQFMDSNNQLLSMPEILTALKSKYGDTLDAMEKLEMSKAFGTEEAVSLVDLFYNKVGELETNINSLGTSMIKGADFTRIMADAMNKDIGAGIALLGQRWHNLIEVIGKQLIPVLAPLFAWIGKIITKVSTFAEEHETLTKVIIYTAMALGGLVAIGGSVFALIGGLGLGVTALIPGFLAATGATWAFTVALLANPITWVVLAVVGLIAVLVYLYKRFEIVRIIVGKFLFGLGFIIGAVMQVGKFMIKWFTAPYIFIYRLIKKIFGVGDTVKSLAKKILSIIFPPLALLFFWDKIKKGIPAVLNFIKGFPAKLFKSGVAMMTSLTDGIKSKLGAPVKVVKDGLQKIRNLLPFSDAKEGPLSTLTSSGLRMMQTFGTGMIKGVPGLKGVLSGALAGLTAIIGVDMSNKLPGIREKLEKPPGMERLFSKKNDKVNLFNRHSNKKETKQVIIKIDKLIVNSDNVESFIKQLQEIADGFDA